MKKYLTMLVALALCISLSACNSTDYKKAEEQFGAKNYEAALPVYTALGDYEDSAEKVKECNYQIGLIALENGEWDKAISSFENSDYKDSAEKLKLSQREKGMHEKADYAFLEAIVESVNSRSVNADVDDYSELVQGEMAILGDFEKAEFYDPKLGRLAKEYIKGVKVQKEALKKEYSEHQIMWQDGMVQRFTVLNRLYTDYGLFQDDINFKKNYLLPFDEQKELLFKLETIHNDLESQLDEMVFEYATTYSVYAPYYNNTRYDFDLQMYFTFYDQNGTRIDDSFNVFPNIRAGDFSRLEIYSPRNWSTCEFFWEIFPK